MEEKEVVISQTVIVFLKELTNVLYQKEYFGFLEMAESYVSDLFDSIYVQIHSENYYKTPEF
jgi:hypothetical protein